MSPIKIITIKGLVISNLSANELGQSVSQGGRIVLYRNGMLPLSLVYSVFQTEGVFNVIRDHINWSSSTVTMVTRQTLVREPPRTRS